MSRFDNYGRADLETVRRIPGIIDFTSAENVHRIDAWIKNHPSDASDRARIATERLLRPTTNLAGRGHQAALEALHLAAARAGTKKNHANKRDRFLK